MRRRLWNPFFGFDTWPWLASSQVHSLGEAVRLAFSPIMPGTQFIREVALFYHPLTSLTYATDLALFGLNASAMYATNVAVHLLTVAALYTLARGVGLSAWAAAAAAPCSGSASDRGRYCAEPSTAPGHGGRGHAR